MAFLLVLLMVSLPRLLNLDSEQLHSVQVARLPPSQNNAILTLPTIQLNKCAIYEEGEGGKVKTSPLLWRDNHHPFPL
ncbi:MAG: hypothetical protein V7K64_05235 [Nostoc sp.]|uniref:hypothetical protein n=1 Tax=Nostoc sp. TaxID=1180 RepID=UPI002FFA0DA0